jgi:hypothetical protein
MYVLFLDIDGVMNSRVFFEKRHKRRWLKPRTWRLVPILIMRKIFGIKSKPTSLLNYKIPDSRYTFEYQFNRLKEETCPEKWQWLSNWCNTTNTKICVSSVWKRHFGIREYNTPEQWENAFVKLGFKPGTYVGITESIHSLRGEEIQDWLDEHPEVKDYAILDDDSDMMDHQFKKFHHCDPWFGLTPNHLYRIERQFNNQTKDGYERLSQTVKK